MPRLGYWNAHSDLDWESILAEAEQQITGPDPYHLGWSACMEWLARVPPDGLSAEARELWLNGYDCAMDAPLGSAAP